MPSIPEEEDMNDRMFAQLKPEGLDERGIYGGKAHP